MIAIDIALLLLTEIEKEILTINKSLKSENQLINFGDDGSIPHISLCMNLVSEEELLSLIDSINRIGKNTSSILVNYNGYKVGNILCDIDVENTDEIYALHKEIIDLTRPYRGREATPDMFVNPYEISEKTCFWAGRYYENSALDKFRPHITLGAGEPVSEYNNSSYHTGRLVIGQLGNYCTVKKVLHEYGVKPSCPYDYHSEKNTCLTEN